MKKVIGLALLVSIVFGCAYYNTFFNAEVYFAEAQEMALRENGKAAPAAVQKYNKVIKKCGVIITDFSKSDYVDDAVMLLGRSLFYKGTSYSQATEKFNDILTFYPNSEFVPDAHIYLARIDYEMKRKNEAYLKLKEFILNPEYKTHHSKALNILANYYLKDENLSEADFYFNQITTKYPKSEQYESAFFARGKTFYLAEKYQKSNEVFTALLKSRVNKQLKLDARYYIAMNYLLTGQYTKAEYASEKLLKKENRDGELGKIRLVLARAKAEQGEVEESIKLCEDIIKSSTKTLLSAETCFYLAEIYFDTYKNYEKAIEYYNQVSKEKRTSPFVEEALSKSVVAAQIIQYYQPNSDISQEDLVDQQFMLAEHYINTLEMPDSALVVYDNIILDQGKLEMQLDSLKLTELELHESLQDSLAHLMEIMASDSLMIPTIPTDSLKMSSDSLSTIVDTLQKQVARVDSVQYLAVKSNREKLEITIEKYRTEIIPYTRFLKLWTYKNVTVDTLKAEAEYEQLMQLPEDNEYAYAATRLWENEPIEFTTLKLRNEKTEYESAITFLEDDPEQSVELLQTVLSDTTHSYYEKAVFGAAYIHYAILSDSIAAKPYVEIIMNDKDSEYKSEVAKFYKDGKFQIYERLPYLIELENKPEKIEEDSESDEDNREARVVGDGKIKWPIIRDELENNVIIIELDISSEGKVTDKRVIQSLIEDKPNYDMIAMAQIDTWDFKPAMKEGKAVESTLKMSFIYEPEKK